jgi:hypothetical protein
VRICGAGVGEREKSVKMRRWLKRDVENNG